LEIGKCWRGAVIATVKDLLDDVRERDEGPSVGSFGKNSIVKN
jgi:hypothetical protein